MLRTAARALAFVVAVVVVTGGAPARPASAAPAMAVTPLTGLDGGDSVTVRAAGLPPRTQVRIIQCDQFNDDPSSDCPVVATRTTGSGGGLATSVVLGDPIFRSQPFGDPVPVYCRADTCRLFLVWSGPEGTNVLASRLLVFRGSPATIEVTPSADLDAGQLVRAAGTAVGARGRTLVVVEEACFAMVQGSGCYGTRTLGTTVVGDGGGWARGVRVPRFLADGTDCASPDILGQCQLTARVLRQGVPDDTYGIARLGDPGAPISFRV